MANAVIKAPPRMRWYAAVPPSISTPLIEEICPAFRLMTAPSACPAAAPTPKPTPPQNMPRLVCTP